MKECKNCLEEIKDELEVCPYCGYIDLNEPEKNNRVSESGHRGRVVLVSSLIVLFGIRRLGDNGRETELTDVSETEFVINGEIYNLKGHSYAVFSNCSTWEEAESNCEDLGGI